MYGRDRRTGMARDELDIGAIRDAIERSDRDSTPDSDRTAKAERIGHDAAFRDELDDSATDDTERDELVVARDDSRRIGGLRILAADSIRDAVRASRT
jgi:hypothetical protein